MKYFDSIQQYEGRYVLITIYSIQILLGLQLEDAELKGELTAVQRRLGEY